MYVAKKILKLNCSPLQFKMSEVEVCHLWAPSEPALQESISSLASTALHDKGGPHWRRLENEVRTVSAQENTVTLLISSGKQEGCRKTDLENPRTWRNCMVSSRFLSEQVDFFFM